LSLIQINNGDPFIGVFNRLSDPGNF